MLIKLVSIERLKIFETHPKFWDDIIGYNTEEKIRFFLVINSALEEILPSADAKILANALKETLVSADADTQASAF